MKKLPILLGCILAFIYVGIGLRSLQHYGVNWDEPVHFGRGQAILHFFLTGKKDYKDLETSAPIRRSFYQSDGYTYTYLENNFHGTTFPVIGAGHPVLSDLLASITNRIVYGWLGLLGDIESYHAYSVFLGAILVGAVTYFTATIYGTFSGIIAGISLLTYPLFLGETRFNIKDPPEAVYYALTAMTFYLGITRNKWRWILLSSIFAGFAFGTKLNVVFLVPSMAIWLFWVWFPKIRKLNIKGFILKHKKVLACFLLFPVVIALFYFGTWPMLWTDPINRFFYNLSYYKTVGIGEYQPSFVTYFGLNTYAAQWIFYTTPIITLTLAVIGLFWTFTKGWKEKQKTSWFIFLWFFVPIFRVMLPHTSIYGGARQIMEYIPPMAILAGIGAGWIVIWLSSYLVTSVKISKGKKARVILSLQAIIILSFLPITLKMISMYPNGSLYFNPIIGGLKGAQAKDIPGWGNSLGSAYRQGVRWINEHAEPQAKIATIYGLRSNIALSDLRPDIEFENRFRSGPMRAGEYIVGVTHQGTELIYLRKYLERFLIPLYEVRVDGVPILKIWKNDLEHTKEAYKKEEQVFTRVQSVIQEGKQIDIDIGQIISITRLIISFSINASCNLPTDGYVEYSIDGDHWHRVVNDFINSSISSWIRSQPEPGILHVLFAAEPVRFVRVMILDENSCLLSTPVRVSFMYL